MSLRSVISWCLLPLTMWYAIGAWFRNVLFYVGILRQYKPTIPTICVGNLSCGGTGKTPHVDYLIHLLQEQYSVAVLSRGYRRSSSGYCIDDGTHSASLLGDEPAMLAYKNPSITVAVAEKRSEGLKQLSKQEKPPQIVILDDAFQHRWVKSHFNILLTDYHDLYVNDHVLPMGNLREPRCGYRRANIIVITKSPEQLNPLEYHDILDSLHAKPYQKVFFSYLRYGDLVPLYDGETQPATSFTHILACSGIANPQPFHAYLKKNATVETLAFPDHYTFRERDIQQIIDTFNHIEGSSKAIVITEKDAARLRNEATAEQLASLPIYYLPIEVAFHPSFGYNFDKEVTMFVRESVRKYQLG